MNEYEILRNSLNISTWMLCVTVFLSVSTVTLSALNMAFQRSHNRKSVKPFCNIHSSINETGIRISIINAGLGPMIIQKIVLMRHGNDSVNKGELFSDILPPELIYDKVVNNKDQYILPPMEEMILLHFTAGSNGKKNTIDVLKSTLESFDICIIFKDIYDHKYEKREFLRFES